MEVKPSPPVPMEIRITDITIFEDRITGAAEIAKFLECSPRHVRRLARRDGVPIFKPPGDDRFIAFKSKLIEWQQTKSA